jgi:hypothetical protein
MRHNPGTGHRQKRKIWPLVNPITVAMDGAARLSQQQIAAALQSASRAVGLLQFGGFGADHWRALADAFNVAEALAGLNIANDHADKFQAAQDALAFIHARYKFRSTWGAQGPELQAIKDALEIHTIQLRYASQSELDRAVNTVRQRCSQAVAGNAGPGVRVLGGEVAA